MRQKEKNVHFSITIKEELTFFKLKNESENDATYNLTLPSLQCNLLFQIINWEESLKSFGGLADLRPPSFEYLEASVKRPTT
jgi:hypothetical protein